MESKRQLILFQLHHVINKLKKIHITSYENGESTTSAILQLQSDLRDNISGRSTIVAFVQLLQSSNMASPVVLSTLDTIQSLFRQQLLYFEDDYPISEISNELFGLIRAVIGVKFVQTDESLDDSVQLHIIFLFRTLLQSSYRQYLSVTSTMDILSFVFELFVSDEFSLAKPMYRATFWNALLDIIEILVSSRCSDSSSTNESKTSASNNIDRTVFSFLRFLVENVVDILNSVVPSTLSTPSSSASSISDKSIHDDTHEIISSLNIIFNIFSALRKNGVFLDFLKSNPGCLELVREDLGVLLLRLIPFSREKPAILQSILALFSLLYYELGPSMALFTESIIKFSFIRGFQEISHMLKTKLLRNSPQSQAFEHGYFTPECLDLIVDFLSDLISDVNFLPNLYLCYDCDPTRANLCEGLLNLMIDCARLASKLQFLPASSNDPQVRGAVSIFHSFLSSFKRSFQVVPSWKDDILQSSSSSSSLSSESLRSFESSLSSQFSTFLHDSKEMKQILLQAAAKFSEKPSLAFSYLQMYHLLPTPLTPSSVALFLRRVPFLAKDKIGSYLGELGKDAAQLKDKVDPSAEWESQEFHRLVLAHFVESFYLEGLHVLDCLRVFLSAFRLPGEAQQIDRILVSFSDHCHRFCAESQQGILEHSDVVYLLTFSIIMLNTDRHSYHIKNERKMTLDQFVKNNTFYGADCHQTKQLPRALLEKIYASISLEPLVTEENHLLQAKFSREIYLDGSLLSRIQPSVGSSCLLGWSSKQLKYLILQLETENLPGHEREFRSRQLTGLESVPSCGSDKDMLVEEQQSSVTSQGESNVNNHGDDVSSVIEMTTDSSIEASNSISISAKEPINGEPEFWTSQEFQRGIGHWDDPLLLQWKINMTGHSELAFHRRLVCQEIFFHMGKYLVGSLLDVLTYLRNYSLKRAALMISPEGSALSQEVAFKLELLQEYFSTISQLATACGEKHLMDSLYICLFDVCFTWKKPCRLTAQMISYLRSPTSLSVSGSISTTSASASASASTTATTTIPVASSALEDVNQSLSCTPQDILDCLLHSPGFSQRLFHMILKLMHSSRDSLCRSWQLLWWILSLCRDSTLLPSDMVIETPNKEDALPLRLRRSLEEKIVEHWKWTVHNNDEKESDRAAANHDGERQFDDNHDHNKKIEGDFLRNQRKKAHLKGLGNKLRDKGKQQSLEDSGSSSSFLSLRSLSLGLFGGSESPNSVGSTSERINGSRDRDNSGALFSLGRWDEGYEKSHGEEDFNLVQLRKYTSFLGLGELLSDSRLLSETSLKNLVLGIVKLIRSWPTTTTNEFDENQDVTEIPFLDLARINRNVLSRSLHISLASESWLENILTDISTRNRDRISCIWPVLSIHYDLSLEDLKEPSYAIERRIVGLFRIATRIIGRSQSTSDVISILMKSFTIHIRELLTLYSSEMEESKSSTKESKQPFSGNYEVWFSTQFAISLHQMFTSNVSIFPSLVLEQWQSLFDLIAVCARMGEYASAKALEIMAWILHEPQLVAKVPVLCFSAIEPLILSPTSPESVSIGAIQLLYHLHARLEILIKPPTTPSSTTSMDLTDSNETSILWENCWMPIVKAIAEGTEDRRKAVRIASVSSLSKILVDPHSNAISAGLLINMLCDVYLPGLQAFILQISKDKTKHLQFGLHCNDHIESRANNSRESKHEESFHEIQAVENQCFIALMECLTCNVSRLIAYPSFDKLWIHIVGFFGAIVDSKALSNSDALSNMASLKQADLNMDANDTAEGKNQVSDEYSVYRQRFYDTFCLFDAHDAFEKRLELLSITQGNLSTTASPSKGV